MTKPTTTIDHQEPNLPSPHVDHSKVFMAELDNRLFGFDAGIATIVAEVSGMQIEFDQETAELEKIEKARQLKHADKLKAKAFLKADMERGRSMALAGKKAYSAEIPSGDAP